MKKNSKNSKHLYILTNDDSYYIVDEHLLSENSQYFYKICNKNCFHGDYLYPIFLQEVDSKTFNKVLEYLKSDELEKSDELNAKYNIIEIKDIESHEFLYALNFLKIKVDMKKIKIYSH